jgi:hypothetical protein
MTKMLVLITGIIWASLLLISWGGAVDVPDESIRVELSQQSES